MPGVAHRKDEEVETEAEQASDVDEQQDAADQRVAVRESHEAIERDGIPDERGESPDVDEHAVDVKDTEDKERHKTVELGGGTHTVTRKDTLWEISQATYGQGHYWKKIRATNPGKVTARKNGTRDLVHTGDELALPVLRVPTAEAIDVLTAGSFVGERLPDMSLEDRAQIVEIFESTGMSYPQMLEEQRRFWAEQAAAQGITIGQYLQETLSGGLGTPHSTADWDEEVANEKTEEWDARFATAKAKVLSESRSEVKAALKEAKKQGGGDITWDPAKMEKLDAFASGGNWNMKVGMDWVKAAEEDVDRVAASILHEMVGHPSGGFPFASNLAYDALQDVDQAQREGLSPDTRVGAGSGYWEMEIFAELYEFSFDSVENLTDHPFTEDPDGNDMRHGKNKKVADVKRMLREAQALYPPTILNAVVRGLWLRIQDDPHVVERARVLFRRDINEVLGDIV